MLSSFIILIFEAKIEGNIPDIRDNTTEKTKTTTINSKYTVTDIYGRLENAETVDTIATINKNPPMRERIEESKPMYNA